MRFIRKYDIDKIGISSSQYLINNFEDFLIKKGFVIVDKQESQMKFRHKYLGVGTFSLASRARFGKITVKSDDENLEIELSYNNWVLLIVTLAMFIFLLIEGVGVIGNIIPVFPLFVFLWIFGMNFIIRYYAQKKIMSYLEMITMKLSKSNL
jgi:hypothetical protein